MTLACGHEEAMRAALAGTGDCPVCKREDQLEQAKQEVARAESQEQRLIAEEIEGPKPKRQKESEISSCEATCRDCKWSKDSKNALGLAAQHHDKTKHTVDVEQTMHVTYGDPDKAGGSKPEKKPEDIF